MGLQKVRQSFFSHRNIDKLKNKFHAMRDISTDAELRKQTFYQKNTEISYYYLGDNVLSLELENPIIAEVFLCK